MVLSLKLELKADNCVLVTNSATQEQIEVTFCFIQTITKDSLPMLTQYNYYELIIDAAKYWSGIKKFKPELETAIIKELKQKELEEVENIRNDVRQQIIEETVAKQQHWDEIAAYKKAQRHNRLSMAIQYADYHLERDYRNSPKERINRDATPSKEKQIIALKQENQALRQRIAELEAQYIQQFASK